MRNLAHEIKNPLGGIRGAAQLLETELRRRAADRVHAASSSTRPTACRRWSTGCWRRTAAARGRRRQHPRGAASACAR
ncbi:MAG: hypothetical protein MZW92_75725 [Comamonadaceae bacterium]|nr:hypothetical protein [Comamonadaceae bacterium]